MFTLTLLLLIIVFYIAALPGPHFGGQAYFSSNQIVSVLQFMFLFIQSLISLANVPSWESYINLYRLLDLNNMTIITFRGSLLWVACKHVRLFFTVFWHKELSTPLFHAFASWVPRCYSHHWIWCTKRCNAKTRTEVNRKFQFNIHKKVLVFNGFIENCFW